MPKIETVKTVTIAVLVTAIVLGASGFMAGYRFANQANAKAIKNVSALK